MKLEAAEGWHEHHNIDRAQVHGNGCSSTGGSSLLGCLRGHAHLESRVRPEGTSFLHGPLISHDPGPVHRVKRLCGDPFVLAVAVEPCTNAVPSR